MRVDNLAVSFDNGSAHASRLSTAYGCRSTPPDSRGRRRVGLRQVGHGDEFDAPSPPPVASIADASCGWPGVDIDLLTLTEQQMRQIRGNDIAMIFQEPMTSLNPVYTIGDQIIEAILLHQNVNVSRPSRSPSRR